MTIKFIEADTFQAYLLAPHLREADVNECRVIMGTTAEEGLAYSVENSEFAFVAEVDGKPVAMFGVGSHNSVKGVGVPWMVGTPDLIKHRKLLMRYAPLWIKRMKLTYPTLINVVDPRNTVHVRWLKRLGFNLQPPQVGLGADPTVPLIVFTG